MGTYVSRVPAPPARGAGGDRSRQTLAFGSHPRCGQRAWGAGVGHGAPWGLLAAAVGVAVWLVVDPRTPDLAGQVYRANLFREAGFLVWDARWYAGHDMPGYSLVFPPLGALVGVRAVGAAAVLASTGCFERAAGAVYGAAARWGAVWFAAAALGAVGRGGVTWAGGASWAGGAARARMRQRPLAAAALAGVCAACSPVAGALVALAGLTHALDARSPRSLVALGVPPAVVVATLAGLFPEGGWEPYPLRSFLATAAVVVGFLWALPARERLLRVGGAGYLAACVACVAVHTPVGANVERYGVLLAGPLLVCALSARPRGARARGLAGGPFLASGYGRVGRRARRRGAPWGGRVSATGRVAVLLGIGVWTVWGPVRETAAIEDPPTLASTSASYYLPVERFVAGVEAASGGPVRVEVPFTRGHWEAAWLAPKVSLARGWEKQLDERYDGVLLGKHLTAAGYRVWLRAEAVGYVALPDAPLDPSSAAEGRLIEAGLPYLREVRRTRHWRIYAVLDPTPLAQGPGALSAIGHDWFTLRARTAGHFTVRVRYTRYFTVTAGAACVGEAPGGWTAVSARRAGAVRVTARFSLGRALGLEEGSCKAVARSGA